MAPHWSPEKQTLSYTVKEVEVHKHNGSLIKYRLLKQVMLIKFETCSWKSVSIQAVFYYLKNEEHIWRTPLTQNLEKYVLET